MMAPTWDPDLATDWMYMAKTIFGESRGEPLPARLAVAWVIRNRARDPARRWGSSVWEVVTRPRQFSCWNPGDPNREAILDPMRRQAERQAWRECARLAWYVLTAPDEANPLPGVLYYHSASLPPPEWARRLEPVAVPGVTRLRFYREASPSGR